MRNNKVQIIMEVLTKDTIEKWIAPHLSVGRRGTKVKVELWRIVAAILYRLKSGCQWQMLPPEKFFTSENCLPANGVYHHFSKWVKNGCFKQVWTALLKANHRLLDLSCMQLDGSQTPAKNGGGTYWLSEQKGSPDYQCTFL